MAKRLTLKEAQTLLQKNTKRLAEMHKEWLAIRKQGDILADKESVLDREWAKIDLQKDLAEEALKNRRAEEILARKLKNLPAGKCVFDRRYLNVGPYQPTDQPIRFRRTYYGNMTGGYISINSKGKERVFSHLNDAKRWASDKPLAPKPKAIDVDALNAVIAKAGFKVVRK